MVYTYFLQLMFFCLAIIQSTILPSFLGTLTILCRAIHVAGNFSLSLPPFRLSALV